MPSPTKTFIIVSFLDNLAVSMILPHLSIHATELGFTHVQIGLVGAVYSGCQLIASPVVGSLSDVRGRKQILLLCMIICSFTYIWLGIASSVLIFLAVRAILGTFKHTQFLIRAIAPDYIDEPINVAILYGKLMAISTIGLAIGPSISGNVMDIFPTCGFSMLCAIIAIIFAVNTVLINKLPDIVIEKKDESKEDLKGHKLFSPNENTFHKSLNKFNEIQWSKYWDIFLFKLLIALAVGLYFNNFNIFLKTEHNVSAKNLGYIISMQGAIGSVSNHLVGYVNKIYSNDRDYSLRIMHIFLVLAVTFIGLSVVPNVYMYVALLIPKVASFALARLVILEVLTSRSEPDNRGTLIGLSNSFKSISGIVSPILSGIINEYLGVAFTFYTGALFASIGVVISYRMRSKSVKEKTS